MPDTLYSLMRSSQSLSSGARLHDSTTVLSEANQRIAKRYLRLLQRMERYKIISKKMHEEVLKIPENDLYKVVRGGTR